MTALQTLFTTEQQTSIDAVCLDLTQRVRHPVTAEYGSNAASTGPPWAVDELHTGSFGRSGPLASILKGTGVDGEAAVIGADGSAAVTGAAFVAVLQAAEDSALVAWTEMA